MISAKRRDSGHSIFRRLLNLAKSRGDDFNLLLLRYGVERFLYRLGASTYADRFLLKGASLFLVWVGQNYRVTRDVDLLGRGPADVENVSSIFKELCEIDTLDMDGMEFMPDSVRAVPIRDQHEGAGIRVTFLGMLHQARVHLQVDIGFGDAVTPGAESITFPTLLDAPPPELLACPRYTMVAEKLEAVVRLGLANSRMKDFYDLWLLSQLFEFDGRMLCEAIRNTFSRRSTPLPGSPPTAFTDAFRKDAQKQAQWRAFVRKSRPEKQSGDMDSVIGDLAGFLMPVIQAAPECERFELSWQRGGPWAGTPEE